MPASDHVVGDLDYSLAATSGGRVTSLPDQEGGSSALDNEGSNGPTLSTSNGSTIATYSSVEFLDWPIQAGVNGRTTPQGFAFWFRPHDTNPANFHETLTTWDQSGGASGTRLNITQHGGALELYGGPGSPTWVRSVASFFTVNTWVFLYVHFDGAETGEARLKVYSCDTSGTVTQHSTSVDTGSLGTTLPSVTGTQIIGAYDDGSTDAVDGDYGQHLWALDDLLTEAEIQELANTDPPVDLGLDLDASGTGQMGAFTASGTAVHPADGVGQMAAFSAAGTAAIAGAAGVGVVEPFTASGAADVEVTGTGTGSVQPFSAAGTADAELTASGTGQLGVFSAAGTGGAIATTFAEVIAVEVLRGRVDATEELRSLCAGRDATRVRVTAQDG